MKTLATSTEETVFKAQRFNNQIDMGVQLFLSGYLLKDLSEIQQQHLEGLLLQRKPNIQSWTRSIITLLLEYSQALWKFRSEIHHTEAKLTQEAILREQAVSLLFSLRSTPYLTRTSEYLRTTQIHNVTSWTHRINMALEDQHLTEKITTMDIRTWMYSGVLSTTTARTRSNNVDNWYNPHEYDSDDSDLTVNYYKKIQMKVIMRGLRVILQKVYVDHVRKP